MSSADNLTIGASTNCFCVLYRPMNSTRQEYSPIGDLIRGERLRLKLNQTDFAALGGVSKATQVAYETNSTEPQASYFRRLHETAVDIGWILTEKRVMKGIQWDLLFQVRDLVQKWAQAQSSPQSQERKDRLLRSLYNQFCASGEIDSSEVESTLRIPE